MKLWPKKGCCDFLKVYFYIKDRDAQRKRGREEEREEKKNQREKRSRRKRGIGAIFCCDFLIPG